MATMIDEPKPLPRRAVVTSGSSVVERHSNVLPSCAQKTFSSWLRYSRGRSCLCPPLALLTMRSCTFMRRCCSSVKKWPLGAESSRVLTAPMSSGAGLMMRCCCACISLAACARSGTTSGRSCSFWPAFFVADAGTCTMPAALARRSVTVMERLMSTPYLSFMARMCCRQRGVRR